MLAVARVRRVAGNQATKPPSQHHNTPPSHKYSAHEEPWIWSTFQRIYPFNFNLIETIQRFEFDPSTWCSPLYIRLISQRESYLAFQKFLGPYRTGFREGIPTLGRFCCQVFRYCSSLGAILFLQTVYWNKGSTKFKEAPSSNGCVENIVQNLTRVGKTHPFLTDSTWLFTYHFRGRSISLKPLDRDNSRLLKVHVFAGVLNRFMSFSEVQISKTTVLGAWSHE